MDDNKFWPPEKWYDRAVAKTPDWSPLDEDTPALDVTLPHGAKLCATGVVLPKELNVEQWVAVGRVLAAMGKCSLWALAEWWAFGREKYRNGAMIAEKLGYDFGYLMNLGWVARSVPTSSRNEALPFTHHMKVAKLSPAAQEQWLEKAVEEEWSANRLEKEIRKEEKAKRQEYERELEQKDADAYRFKKSHEKAAEAICEFQKIAKGGGGHWRLDHSIDAIIADDPYLSVLLDEALAKLLEAATSVIVKFEEAVAVLKQHQERRAKLADEPDEAEDKAADDETAENADEAEEVQSEPVKKKPVKSQRRKKPRKRERLNDNQVKQLRKKKAA